MREEQIFYPAGINSRAVGQYVTQEDSSCLLTLNSNTSSVVNFTFSIPRSSINGAGTSIKSIAVYYRIAWGELNFVHPILRRWSISDKSEQAGTTIPLNSGVFNMRVNSQPTSYNRVSCDITSPEIDNQPSAVSILYQLSLSFTAQRKSDVVISGIDVIYDKMGCGSPTSTTGGGTISLNSPLHEINATGNDILILPDGHPGHQIYILFVTKSSDIDTTTVVPNRFHDGVSMLFSQVGQFAHLVYSDSIGWKIIKSTMEIQVGS